ncbi:MAG: hypothetical protein MHMPM18_002367 [Marteilia pararefringens]
MSQQISKKFLSLIKSRSVPDFTSQKSCFPPSLAIEETRTIHEFEPCRYSNINHKVYHHILEGESLNSNRQKIVSDAKCPIRKSQLIENPFNVREDALLRPIVVDGMNVAMQNGSRRFSWRHLEIVVDFFLSRGHTDINVVLPKRCEGQVKNCIEDFRIMKRLRDAGALVWAPTRETIDGRNLNPYDDRYIVRVAEMKQAIIVSNDQYRDLMRNNILWKEYIKDNLLMFTFVGHAVLFPEDPLGKDGPCLDDFLKKDVKQIGFWQALRKLK